MGGRLECTPGPASAEEVIRRREARAVPDVLLGSNYWPRRSARYRWQRFDRGEVREDMARLAGLGLHAVRFFLLWEDFQPARDRLDATMLQRLEAVMGAIADAKLRAMPTLFTGHMSGVNWLPEWTLDAHTPHGRFRTLSRGRELPFGIGDFYTGALLDAQLLFARGVGERLRDHPALWTWDLGNEFSNLRHAASPQDAANWSAVLTDALVQTSNAPVSAGTHGEDLTRDTGIRLSSLAKPHPFANMHGYSVYSAFARNRLDADVVPFLGDVAHAFARKPVLFSEFGNPTCPQGMISPYERVPLPDEPPVDPSSIPANAATFACLSETEMCAYAYAALDGLQRRGGLGGFWWCYADYAEEVAGLPPFDRAPHELSFGIVRADGSEKPIAQTLQRFAAEKRQTLAPAQTPIVSEAAWYAGLPLCVQEAYERYTQTTPSP